jgi:predicted metalloprotease with PDZ domain
VQSPSGAPTPPIKGQNTSPHFGIEVTASVDGQYQGLQVLGFSPDSKAPAIGLQAGDLIVSINGIRTETLSAVELAQRTIAAGQQSILHIVRDGQLYQAQLPATATPQTGPSSSVPADGAMALTAPGAQASAKPPVSEPSPSRAAGPTLAKPRASLGLVVLDATPQRGVLVSTVREGTVGELAGLQANDRIVSAAGRLIRDTSGLIRELALSNPGDSVKLGIVRGDVPQEIEVEMGGPGGIPARAAVDDRESAKSQPDKPDDTVMPAPKPDSENLPVPSNQSDDGKANTDDPNDETGSGESLLSDPLALPEDDASVDTLPAPKP